MAAKYRLSTKRSFSRIADDIRAKGIRAAAISSVFSPVNTDCETKARDILRKALPDVQFTLSSDIGRIGLLERENAAIMNACLCDLAYLVVDAFRIALDACGVKARFFLTQNDGTLMDAAYAERFPVLTFASGPTNSIRGAAFLSGVSDAIVVDIGGTTSDVGSLHKGFPRPATVAVEVGGVRTNFRMPDVFSMGLGGGSLVVDGPEGRRRRAALGRLQACDRSPRLRRLDADDDGRRGRGRACVARRSRQGRQAHA